MARFLFGSAAVLVLGAVLGPVHFIILALVLLLILVLLVH